MLNHPLLGDISPVLTIVRDVRTLVLPHYGNVTHRAKSEEAHDLVTDLDIAVEEHLRKELSVQHPSISFVGEETGGDRSASLKWICDPIDGTGHFIRGLPFCTTMLALVENGVVTLGIIYNFVSDTMHYAVRDQGAYREDTRISVSTRPLNKSYLSWETHIRKEENLKKHLLLIEQRASFFKTACAGYEFTLVAQGCIDGRICFDGFGKDYDYAAGSLLVHEAGGIVANIGKNTYDYTNLDFLAVNPVIYRDLTTGDAALFPLRA